MTYNPKNISYFHLPHFSKTVKNYAVISAVIFLISITSIGAFQKFVFGETYEPLDIANKVAEGVYEGMQGAGDDVFIASSEKWGEEVFLEGQVAGTQDEAQDNSIEE